VVTIDDIRMAAKYLK